MTENPWLTKSWYQSGDGFWLRYRFDGAVLVTGHVYGVSLWRRLVAPRIRWSVGDSRTPGWRSSGWAWTVAGAKRAVDRVMANL